MDCSPLGSFVLWILQARILEWFAMPSCKVSSQSRDWTCDPYVSCRLHWQVGSWPPAPPEKPNANNLLLLLLLSHSESCLTLQPHGLQNARLPCPSPSPRACSNSCPLTRWHHPTISSSVIPFSSCLQSFPASGSFLMSQIFTSGGQSIGVSASALVSPMTIQGWYPLGLTGLISFQSKGLSRIFSSTTVKIINYSVLSLLYGPTLISIHDYWKNHSFD